MNELIHISQRKNRQSILQNGIKPTYVKFQFQRDLLNNYGLDDNVIFTWVNNDNRYKYIKDLIFAKNWLHPRNEFLEKLGYNGVYDYDMKDYDDRYIKPIDENIYDVYLIDKSSNQVFTHQQSDEDTSSNSSWGMPDEYQHFNKTLHIFDKEPIKEVKIIESVKYRINKRGKYTFKHISK